MNNSNPPLINPNPQNCNENNHPRQWPPQPTMTQPQMQQQNNWHHPQPYQSHQQQYQQMPSHHQQQFQHSSSSGQYGQYAPIPMRFTHPPPPIVWQHQYHPQQQQQQQNQNYIQQPPKFELPNHLHQQQQNDKLSSQELRRLLNAQQELNKELTKEKKELEDKASKALATARMYEMKMATAYEEIGKMRSELARMEILMRTAEKECQEKQQKLNKMEATEMEENKKKKLILRTKSGLQQPPNSTLSTLKLDIIDKIIEGINKTATKKQQPVKKVVEGMGQGKRQQPQQQCTNINGTNSDYAPPGAKKERIAPPNNANHSQPIVNSISYCAPSISSKSPSKKPTQLHKSFGNEALLKIGAPPYVRRTIVAPSSSTAQSTTNVVGQLKQENNDLEEQCKTTRCEHWYSADCEKCKERYGI